MQASEFSKTNRLAVRRLRLEWVLWGLVAGLFAAGGYAAIRSMWGADHAARWLAAAILLLLYQFGYLWQHIDENRLKGVENAPLFDNLGLANSITIFRSVLIAGLVGFLFVPRPSGWLAWAPGVLFLAGALMDYLDGYVARITRRTTLLGERLDMQWDSVGVLVAALLSVQYGQTPLAYLLIGLARYLYLIGLWLHRKRGGFVVDLPPDRFRRAMSGMQMGFLSVILLPVYSPPATQIAALLFMLPTMAGFTRDFLFVTGRQASPFPSRLASGAGFWHRPAFLLPLVLRVVLIVLLVDLFFLQLRQNALPLGILLVVGAAVPALLLGVTGRLAALAVLLMAGFALRVDLQDGRYWAILLCAILLFMTGTGKYSLWAPEDWLIDHRAGEVRS